MPDTTKAGCGILWALKQVGKAYRMGAEAKLLPEDFGNPNAFQRITEYDCSELAQCYLWAAGVESVNGVHVQWFDGAWKQYEQARHIPIETARLTIGALIFVQSATSYPDKPLHIGHVGIVIAPGFVLEARGRDYGVLIGPVRKTFGLGAKIDELYQ
jgi:cell wall-associated NlpC family hydrolase